MSLTTETRWHSGTKEFEFRAVYHGETQVATMYRHFPCPGFKNGFYTAVMPGSPGEIKCSPRFKTVGNCLKWIETQMEGA